MSWKRFVHRASWDRERARELDVHLQIEIADNVARGMTPAEARAAAHRALGNTTLVREEIYRMNSLRRLETLWQDLAYATRLLRRSPTFTIVAVCSLALGIGANTAIFQLLDTVRLRPLPVDRPSGLVEVKIVNATHGRTGNFSSRHATLTDPIWQRIRDEQRVLSNVFAWSAERVDLADSGESRPAEGLLVSGLFFSTLGVRPVAGRLLDARDDERGCGSPAVVISEGFWQREFGGDRAAVGRTLRLNGRPFAIVGVSPAAFFGVEVGHPFDVAAPLCAEPLLNGADSQTDRADGWWLGVMGRLEPGMSIERASSQLAAISPAIFHETVSSHYAVTDAENYQKFQLGALPAETGVTELRDQYEQPLWVLLAIAGLVLLIACGNLANLLLARASVRAREMAVRLAIGASRSRLVRQLMVESLLLATVGAGLGAWIARQLSRALVSFLSTPQNPLAFNLAVDGRVFAFTVGAGALTCLIFGLAPAIRATQTAPTAALRAVGRSLTDSRDRFVFRRALVIGQMALSVMLCVAALLFVRTFWNLAFQNPGFRTAGVRIVHVDYSQAAVPVDQQEAFQQTIASRLRAIPGAGHAASMSVVPLDDDGANDTLVIDGVPRKPFPNLNQVGQEFFSLMQIPMVAGRLFSDRDTRAAPLVAIVNRAFGRAFFGGGNVLGRTFEFTRAPNEPHPAYTIVGVVADTKYSDLRDPLGPIIYFPDRQDAHPGTDVSIAIHTDQSAPDASGMTAAIVAAVRQVSPVARVDIRSLDAIARGSIAREQLMATLSGFFAVLAGLLAAVGLYGVLSYGVSRRQGEIGIRMALGASPWNVLRLVLGEASVLVGIGLAMGLGLAAATGRYAASLLFNLKPHDVPTMIVAAGTLSVIAAIASAIPAARAARLAPTAALRE
jgi:putative ABC transport system permease protein